MGRPRHDAPQRVIVPVGAEALAAIIARMDAVYFDGPYAQEDLGALLDHDTLSTEERHHEAS